MEVNLEVSIFTKLDSLDRRWIFAFQALVFCIVILNPVGLALNVGDQVRTAFEAIESLPEGSIVWFATDYQAANAAELEPAAIAIFKHCMQKNLRVISGSTWPEGGAMMSRLINYVAPEFPDKEYGVDYLNLGYRPGGQVWLQQLTDDLPAAVGGLDHWRSHLSLSYYGRARSDSRCCHDNRYSCWNAWYSEYIRVITDPTMYL